MRFSMKKYLVIVIVMFFVNYNCKAQNKKSEDFIPNGYVLYEKFFGDLNKDGQEDCILIVKGTNKDNIVINRFDEKVDRNRRGIIILLKNQDNYKLSTANYDCFSSENEDGGVYFAPELLIKVERGNLIIHYAHGRYGFWRYIFRYQDSNFKLIGYDQSNGGVVISSELSINFLTKKKLIRENTNLDADGGDEVFKDTWSKIIIKKLLVLSEIKDFDELSMSY